MNVENTHEKPPNPLCGLWKQLLWDSNASENRDHITKLPLLLNNPSGHPIFFFLFPCESPASYITASNSPRPWRDAVLSRGTDGLKGKEGSKTIHRTQSLRCDDRSLGWLSSVTCRHTALGLTSSSIWRRVKKHHESHEEGRLRRREKERTFLIA